MEEPKIFLASAPNIVNLQTAYPGGCWASRTVGGCADPEADTRLDAARYGASIGLQSPSGSRAQSRPKGARPARCQFATWHHSAADAAGCHAVTSSYRGPVRSCGNASHGFSRANVAAPIRRSRTRSPRPRTADAPRRAQCFAALPRPCLRRRRAALLAAAGAAARLPSPQRRAGPGRAKVRRQGQRPAEITEEDLDIADRGPRRAAAAPMPPEQRKRDYLIDYADRHEAGRAKAARPRRSATRADCQARSPISAQKVLMEAIAAARSPRMRVTDDAMQQAL